MDGQRKWRYRSKEVECTTSDGSGVGQKQMETSTSSLIVIEMMEESRRRTMCLRSDIAYASITGGNKLKLVPQPVYMT